MSYRDASRPTVDRVHDLLSRMTLAEKVAQLGSLWVYELTSSGSFDEEKALRKAAHGLGQVTRLGGASLLPPAQAARLGNRIQRFLMTKTRLPIPALIHEEACSGYLTKDADIFPQAIGLAAGFDPEIVEEIGRAISTQLAALGARQALAPLLDVTRDPRWGRVEETFGEDPYLVSRMGAAFIRGLQGDDIRKGVLATGKHFAGYGCPEGGMNWAPSHIPPRELLETYLYPFEVAVKEAGLQAVMPSYGELDGIPCHSDDGLLTGILRGKWGFDGIIVSDYFGIDMLRTNHRLARTKNEAAGRALRAGIDVELPSSDCYGPSFGREAGDSAELITLIDAAAERILKKKFELGLFDEPFVDEAPAKTCLRKPEGKALSLRAALASMVLLKNDGVLPLGKSARRIAVVGPNADEVRNLLGDYTFPAHVESLLDMAQDNFGGSPLPDDLDAVRCELPLMDSMLEGIRKAAGDTEILYARGCAVSGDDRSGFGPALAAADASDVIVAVMGDKSGLVGDCTCGEARDRSSLDLPGVQRELLQALSASGKPIVLVLISGRPHALEWEDAHLSAILQAWLPGESGAEAASAVLFGKTSPAGRTPISFPRTVGQVPVFYAHKPSGGRSHWKGDYVDGPTTPLYPFGHGLSYTAFGYSALEAPGAIAMGEEFDIAFVLGNLGSAASDETPQLYVRRPSDDITVPDRELIGFARVFLNPGECKRVVFRLSTEQLGHIGRDMQYVVSPGEITFRIGASSQDIRLSAVCGLSGEPWKPERKRYATAVAVAEV